MLIYPSFALLLACLTCCGTTHSLNSSRRMLETLVDLIEMEYADYCESRAEATWAELVHTSSDTLQTKLKKDKSFGVFSSAQTLEVRNMLPSYSLGAGDEVLRRKVALILQPGDSLLDTDQWIRLVKFGEKALHNLRYATDYDCGSNTNCSLKEFKKSLAAQHDKATLHRMKVSWEEKLPDLDEYRNEILPLLRNASKRYNYTTVEEYWDFLGEYEGGLLKARELWDQIKPLYLKLQKYVSLRLLGEGAVGKPIPVHTLRSLTGDDWSNVIEDLLPKYPDIYQKLHANLQLKNVGGKEAFRIAEKLIDELHFGPSETKWDESYFDGTCPAVIIDSCRPEKELRAFTCKDISISNYMDAHEAVMKMKHREIAASHSNNTYILREANRYSAIYEAIPGFASLLSLTPDALNRAGLYPLERFNYRNNPNHHRLVLQLIIALRDLPKLNYYLALDEWRLQILKESISSSNFDSSSWSKFRKNFSLLEITDIDLLGETYVLQNRPFIGKFMGMILKYQIYQSYAEEMINDNGDLTEHISENNVRVLDAMSRGYGVPWHEMVGDLLAKRENGLDSTALTDYFRLLDEYLDTQLEPGDTDHFELFEYEEPPEETINNEIPANENKDEVKQTEGENAENTIHTHELDILENIIDTDEEATKQETSTVGVLEIKNPVASNDEQEQPPKEASYGTYWWIGIGVALAVVVLLIAIIAKKRQSHRKQLERQRRQTTHA